MQDSIQYARRVFKKQKGVLRTSDALAAGIHPRTLYSMRDEGSLVQYARGLFRLADLPPLDEPDLVTVSKRIPKSVICLISSLAFHDLTTQIPHRIQIALPRTTRNPILKHPPIQVFRFSDSSYHAGVEAHVIDGMKVHIYSPEKSIADAFQYRNKIGLDVAVEALRTYCEQKKTRLQRILQYARIGRVEKVIRPYLEALT